MISSLVEKRAHAINDGLLRLRLVAKTREPFDPGLLAEPRHLALGVAPRVALRVKNGFGEAQLAVQKLYGLAVSVRFERLGRGRKTAR